MPIVKSPNLWSMVCAGRFADGVSTAHLEAMWMSGRDGYLRSGVTGALLIADGEFMQCVEGTEQCVRHAFEKFRVDTDRIELFEILNEPTEKRAVERWHMGVSRASRTDLLAASTARWETQYLWSQGWKVPRALELLRLFWSRESFGEVTSDAAVRDLPSARPAPARDSQPTCVN
jgi:Sensors of blue-light using FAD